MKSRGRWWLAHLKDALAANGEDLITHERDLPLDRGLLRMQHHASRAPHHRGPGTPLSVRASKVLAALDLGDEGEAVWRFVNTSGRRSDGVTDELSAQDQR